MPPPKLSKWSTKTKLAARKRVAPKLYSLLPSFGAVKPLTPTGKSYTRPYTKSVAGTEVEDLMIGPKDDSAKKDTISRGQTESNDVALEDDFRFTGEACDKREEAAYILSHTPSLHVKRTLFLKRVGAVRNSFNLGDAENKFALTLLSHGRYNKNEITFAPVNRCLEILLECFNKDNEHRETKWRALPDDERKWSNFEQRNFEKILEEYLLLVDPTPENGQFQQTDYQMIFLQPYARRSPCFIRHPLNKEGNKFEEYVGHQDGKFYCYNIHTGECDMTKPLSLEGQRSTRNLKGDLVNPILPTIDAAIKFIYEAEMRFVGFDSFPGRLHDDVKTTGDLLISVMNAMVHTPDEFTEAEIEEFFKCPLSDQPISNSPISSLSSLSSSEPSGSGSGQQQEGSGVMNAAETGESSTHTRKRGGTSAAAISTKKRRNK